jgi:hypothetical protein
MFIAPEGFRKIELGRVPTGRRSAEVQPKKCSGSDEMFRGSQS